MAKITFLRLWTLLAVWGICCPVIGQTEQEIDTAFRVPFGDKIIIKINMDSHVDSYLLRDNSDDSRLNIRTNNDLRLFLSLDYEFIGASIGFSPSFLSNNRDGDEKGKSSFSDYKFRFFLGRWVQSVQYRQVGGFYVENTEDYIPGWVPDRDPFIQIPDLKNTKWGMSTSYVLNDRFSYRNITYQTEWQRKSAGSLIPTLHYRYERMSLKINDTNGREDLYSVLLSVAYHYTHVVDRNWFFSPYLAPSLGIAHSKYRSLELRSKVAMYMAEKQDYLSMQAPEHSKSQLTGETEGGSIIEINNYLTRSLEGGLQIGFSSRKVIFGGGFTFDINWHKEDSHNSVENDKLYGLLYIGYRFGAPKALRKLF